LAITISSWKDKPATPVVSPAAAKIFKKANKVVNLLERMDPLLLATGLETGGEKKREPEAGASARG